MTGRWRQGRSVKDIFLVPGRFVRKGLKTKVSGFLNMLLSKMNIDMRTVLLLNHRNQGGGGEGEKGNL